MSFQGLVHVAHMKLWDSVEPICGSWFLVHPKPLAGSTKNPLRPVNFFEKSMVLESQNSHKPNLSGKSTETLGLIQQKESVVFGDVVSETVVFRVSKWNI